MKWLVLVFFACVGFALFAAHEKSVKKAEAEAREAALEEGRREAAEQLAAERSARQKEEQERARLEALNARRPAMAISKVLEPLLLSVQAPLEIQRPADLVPVIELTKQRILDKREQAEPERRPVFDRATAAMDYLAALAEERTNFLEAMLRNRASSGTMLNHANTGSNSNFFAQNTAKRWEETVARAKPTTLQLMEQLRTAEREWNKQLDRQAIPESYEVHSFGPLLIPAEQVSPNALTPGAKPTGGSSGTATRIWRRPFYTQYGYRYPTYYYPY